MLAWVQSKAQFFVWSLNVLIFHATRLMRILDASAETKYEIAFLFFPSTTFFWVQRSPWWARGGGEQPPNGREWKRRSRGQRWMWGETPDLTSYYYWLNVPDIKGEMNPTATHRCSHTRVHLLHNAVQRGKLLMALSWKWINRRVVMIQLIRKLGNCSGGYVNMHWLE